MDGGIYLEEPLVIWPSSNIFDDEDLTLTVLLLPSILNIVSGLGGKSSSVAPIPTKLVRPSLEQVIIQTYHIEINRSK